MGDSRPQACIIFPATITPVALTVLCLTVAFWTTPWALAGLPFIWIGALAAQPNLNLVNGCLAYLAMAGGLALHHVHEPLGMAVLVGAAAGFYAGAVEKRLTMKPYP